MSIVRYVNKKTGRVSVYESTSHYDPETKQSRPIRKYLGMEDPETGELIPSSGRRGRRKASEQEEKKKTAKKEPDYKLLAESYKKQCMEKEDRIKKLEHRNAILYADLKKIRDLVSEMLSRESGRGEAL